MPLAGAPASAGGATLVHGGQAVDFDAVARLMLQLAGEAADGAPMAMPLSPAGSAGPGHPVGGPPLPPALDALPLPGHELTQLGTLQLLEGRDPSLLSFDLLPLHAAGRDLPSTQPGAMPPASPGVPARSAGLLPAGAPVESEVVSPGVPEAPYFVTPPVPDGPRSSGAPTTPRPSPRIRDDFPLLQQKVNGHRLVWLDSAATTQKPNHVIETEAAFYRRDNSNVHRGAHTLAKRATEAYESARLKVQRFLNAEAAEEIVFVRGATEGMNLIAQSLGRQIVGEGDEVLVTELEHHSNIVPWQMLCAEKKARLRVIPVDDRGEIRLADYEAMLNPRVRIVSMTHVSNVLGTIVPVAPMAALAHRHGAVVVVDGAQSVAHFPVDVRCLGVDFYVFSGHKLYAPTGIGAVYGRREWLHRMPPWQGGGSMIESVSFEHTVYAPPPAKFEAGTGHFAGAVGLGAAIDYVEAVGRKTVAAHEQALMQHALQVLPTVPGLKLLGNPTVRFGALPFVMEDLAHGDVARALDQRGIAVRAGHHCAQPILKHYGLEASVRASLGIYSEHDDIDCLVAALREIRAGRRTVAVAPPSPHPFAAASATASDHYFLQESTTP